MSLNMQGEIEAIHLLIEKRLFSEALQKLDQLTAIDQTNYRVWRTRAHYHSQAGEPRLALLDMDRAIELNALEPDLFYTRGIINFEDGAYPAALADFAKVIELSDLHDSDYYRESAHFFRADCFCRLGDRKQAIEECTYVRDELKTWTDRIRSKADILKECEG